MMNLNYQVALIPFQIFKIILNKSLKRTTIPRIHVYINRIINRLVFKIKDGYRIEFKTPETIKLFGSPKINRQNKKQRKCAMPRSSLSSFSPM